MTISTTSSQVTVAATGASSYSWPMIGVAASDISVLYTATNGTITTVPSTAYTVSLNAPATGSIWGIGGTISPVTPSNYTSGSLTIIRTLPFTQNSAISNQGNQYPTVTETALDTLCMEIQQVAARTGAYRGVWVTGATYNFGDIVQDGVNGAYTNNIYVAAQGNTSGVWATDLAAGDWVLAISVATLQPPGSFLPLSGGTVSGNLTVSGTTTLAAVTTSAIDATALNISGLTASELVATDGSKNLTNVTALPSGTTATTQAAGDNSTKIATMAAIQAALGGTLLNVQVFTASGTYTPAAGTSHILILNQAGGGGGGGSGGSGGGTGGTGETTSVGSLVSATGGVGGIQGTANGTIGGAGGVGSLGLLNLAGSGGGATHGDANSSTYMSGAGGYGGVSFFGGAALQSPYASAGYAAGANTGSGGSGASGAPSTTLPGSGGGAGGFSIDYVANTTTQTVTIGLGGAGGTAGTSGSGGGAGGSGVVVIWEYK